MKKIYILENSLCSEDKFYFHELIGEKFQQCIARYEMVRIYTLTEESDAKLCAAIAAGCLEPGEAILVGLQAMEVHEEVGTHLIKMLERTKEFVN